MYKLCTSVTLLCTHNGNWKATLTFKAYRLVCLQERRRIGPICLNVCRENTDVVFCTISVRFLKKIMMRGGRLKTMRIGHSLTQALRTKSIPLDLEPYAML